jgi:hypothetical protein
MTFANSGSEMKEDPVNVRSAASCYDIGTPIVQLNQARSRPFMSHSSKSRDSVHSMSFDKQSGHY